MIKVFNLRKLFIFSGILVSLLFVVKPLFAQEIVIDSWKMPLPWEIKFSSPEDKFGIGGLSNEDPRNIAANNINIAVSFLGIIAIMLIVYGFFIFRKKENDIKRSKSAKAKIILGFIILIIAIAFYVLSIYVLDAVFRKPVIYLYPEKEQEITVQLDYQGTIIADYPDYNEMIGGWKVTAFPDGKIINHDDKQEYNYLFWEGKTDSKINWDLSTGFVVKGADTKKFLQETLPRIGLTPKEYNEFIVYWYPLLMNNKYNLIHFADKQYSDTAPLNITPEPDSMLRIFMVYKPLSKFIEIEPQIIKPFERKGFTVVEWGGVEIK